jgi:hypothetical protein
LVLQADNVFSLLSHITCGSLVANLTSAAPLHPTAPSALNLRPGEQLASLAANSSAPLAPWPEGCSLIYYSLTQWEGWTGKVIWSFLRPILQGEVLYTPDNEVTASIIRTANKTFAAFAEFRSNVQAFGGVYSDVRNINMYKGDAGVLTGLLFSDFYTELADSYLADKYSVNLTDFKDQNLTRQLEVVEAGLPFMDIINILAESLSCMRTDRSPNSYKSPATTFGRFFPRKSEADIIAKASSETPNFLAGLVFK